MQYHIVTGFPGMFEGPLSESMMKRAQERGIVNIYVHDLRAFASDPHRKIDDYPYGGGPGMVLKPEPIFKCIDYIKKKYELPEAKVILMSPQGKIFSQEKANQLVRDKETFILLCGHYKGIDERVCKYLIDEEISIGDYVLTGGELPAMAVLDAVVRLLPGVLNDFDSAMSDSFQTGFLDHPHYTRPETFQNHSVPDVLLSGHHAKIEAWRQKMVECRTRERRADLIEKKLLFTLKEETP